MRFSFKFRCLCVGSILILCTILSGSIATAAVSVALSDVRLNRDGVGLVKIFAVDEALLHQQTITSFRLQLRIENSLDPSRRVIFQDEDSIAAARHNNDYVFADKFVLLTDAEISSDGQLLTITEALDFTEPASSLSEPQTLGTFRVGVASGDRLTVDDQFDIAFTDLNVLYGDGGAEINSSGIQYRGGTVVVTAVPEPSSIAAWAVMGFLVMRKRTGRKRAH